MTDNTMDTTVMSSVRQVVDRLQQALEREFLPTLSPTRGMGCLSPDTVLFVYTYITLNAYGYHQYHQVALRNATSMCLAS